VQQLGVAGSKEEGPLSDPSTQRLGTLHGSFDDLLGFLNPATVRGGAAVIIGTLILLLPNLSVALVEGAVAVGALVSGAVDIWFGLSGRRRRYSPRSRVLAVLRGLLSLGFAGLLILVPRTALGLVVSLVGLYLLVRGSIAVIGALTSRGAPGWELRLTGGVLSFAVGLLAWASPGTIAEGLIITGAIAALILGGIVLVYGLRAPSRGDEGPPPNAPVSEILWEWIRHVDVGSQRRDDLADGLYYEQPQLLSKLEAFAVQLVLSVAIATFAIIQDSTAVVIGAMLIAPLMVPILGLAGALVNGWSRRAWQSTLLLVGGVTASVLLSYSLAAWTPAVIAFETNTQITSRVNPSLPDMLIAIAAGAAGAFATVNARVASSLPGVAIAVALVPPLAVVGVTLGGGRFNDAAGAMLLFLTNFVAIVLSAAVVFALGGFARHDLLRSRARSILVTFAPFAALAALILVPLVFTSEGLLATSADQRDAQIAVEEWLGEDADLSVVGVVVSEDIVDVRLRGADRPPPLEDLQAALIEDLGRPVGVSLSITPVSVQELPPPLP
jgi:uncharacterized hydrophobic protein (TIGR00271 family)